MVHPFKTFHKAALISYVVFFAISPIMPLNISALDTVEEYPSSYPVENIVEEQPVVVEPIIIEESVEVETNVEQPSEWELNDADRSANLLAGVQSNINYSFPYNELVNITFTRLPVEGVHTLKIQEKLVTLEDNEYTAYEITSDLENGTFEYVLNLPNVFGINSEVKYSENGLVFENIDEEVLADSVTLTADHFTIFVVTPSSSNPPVQSDCDAVELGTVSGTTCFTTIQAAINAAAADINAPHTINIAAGTYTENIVINDDPQLTGLTIQGAGMNNTTINGQIYVNGGLNTVNYSFEGFTLNHVNGILRGFNLGREISNLSINFVRMQNYENYALSLDSHAVIDNLEVTNSEFLNNHVAMKVASTAKVNRTNSFDSGLIFRANLIDAQGRVESYGIYVAGEEVFQPRFGNPMFNAITIQDNVIRNITNIALYAEVMSNAFIFNNNFTSNHIGLKLWKGWVNGSALDNIRIDSNDFLGNGVSQDFIQIGGVATSTSGEGATEGIEDLFFLNNTFNDANRTAIFFGSGGNSAFEKAISSVVGEENFAFFQNAFLNNETDIIYNIPTFDLDAKSTLSWTDGFNIDFIERKLVHDCVNSPYIHGVCNGNILGAFSNDYSSGIGSIDYLYPYNITGYKYEDLDNNGLPNAAIDRAIENWPFRLYGENWDLVDDTTSSSSGQNTFHYVRFGNYFVCEIMFDGWTQVYPVVGEDGVVLNQSGASDEGENCWEVIMTDENEFDLRGYDFANVQQPVITVIKNLLDQEGDDLDATQLFDVAISGAGVLGASTGQITDNGQNSQNTVFNVLPGTFEVTESDVEGYDNLGCFAEGFQSSTFTVSSGDSITVTCTNQVTDLAPSVSISTAPGDATTEAAITMTANILGGNAPVSIVNWFGGNFAGCAGDSASVVTPSTAGNYTCSVIVEDEDGDTAVATKSVVVNSSTPQGGDLTPTVILFGNSPATNNAGTVNVLAASTFTISASLNNLGNPAYDFSFGGICAGSVIDTVSTLFTSNSMNLAAGSYVCTVNVVDSDGDVALASVPVIVTAGGIGGPAPEVQGTSTQNNGTNGTGDGSDEDVLGAEAQVCEETTPVSGFVFFDSNVDNDKDSNENGVSGIDLTIFVLAENDEGIFEERVIRRVNTDFNGNWSLDLCPGEYRIRIDTTDLPRNSVLGGGDEFGFTVTEDEKDDVNFAIYNVGSIAGDATFNWWIIVLIIILLVLGGGIYIYTRRSNDGTVA